MDQDEVRSFYDDFLESKMLDYRISGNLRIEKATQRILDFVRSGDVVLDVGCGIGITAERVANKAEHVWAFDISKRNIWYARKTVEKSNITFFTSDVSENRECIKERLPTTVDVITLVDVIEHIPQKSHAELFEFFGSIMNDQSFIVLTYPSPKYQRHLKENDPDKLQIVDQVIERDELLADVKSAGFSLRHYSLETVWRRNQYVHCVLQTDSSLSYPPQEKATDTDSLLYRILMSVRFRIKHKWKNYVEKPYRRWKYVERIFK